jgi:hypothetical protein
LYVQPAWPHVNSAEPAGCHGDEAAPATGVQPAGLSHCTVNRTDICEAEPLPASCARAPSWVGLQMFTCAQEELRLSPVWALAAPAPATAAQIAIGIRLLRSTAIAVGSENLPLKPQASR